MRIARLMGLFAVSLCFVFGSTVYANNNGFDVDWYGYFKLDGARDQNPTDNGNYTMYVQPQATTSDDEQFNMTANQSRLGLTVTNNQYDYAHLSGTIEFDLYGGGAENKAHLMMRHAYLSIQSGNTRIVAGQTYDIVAPLNPSTLNYTVLWGCGNTGYRRPQVSLWHTFNPQSPTQFVVAAGMFRTIGDDLGFTLTATADGDDDGSDAGIPSFQGMLEVNHKLSDGSQIQVGASGMWEQLKAESALTDDYENYQSWEAAGHFKYSSEQGWGICGEAFTGVNLKSYYGCILENSSIDGINTFGGWASAWFTPVNQWKVTAGYGMEDPDDEDLASSARCKNSCCFGNINYSIVPQATVGLEASYWQTDYKDSDSADNLRVQSSFILKF
jgi:hypothetical protein